jgi:shikimate kinase
MTGIRNIVIIGFMGAGKTVVGKSLANSLKRPFIDTDKLVEESVGATIEDIFQTLGEERFRTMETDAIKSISDIRGAVIATGGGAINNPENVALLKSGGFVVYLYASPETLFNRISKETGRPLVGRMKDQADMEVLLEQRDPLYRQTADLVVDTTDQTIDMIEHQIFQAIGY